MNKVIMLSRSSTQVFLVDRVDRPKMVSELQEEQRVLRESCSANYSKQRMRQASELPQPTCNIKQWYAIENVAKIEVTESFPIDSLMGRKALTH